MTVDASLVVWDRQDDPLTASRTGVLCWQS
jgi:hypothetical protein